MIPNLKNEKTKNEIPGQIVKFSDNFYNFAIIYVYVQELGSLEQMTIIFFFLNSNKEFQCFTVHKKSYI